MYLTRGVFFLQILIHLLIFPLYVEYELLINLLLYLCCRHVTFLCGRGGVYALGAVVANYMGDHPKRDMFLGLFNEVL